MKNVTITLDEDVLRWARIRAAEQESSVSRIVGDLLRKEMAEEADVSCAIKEWLADAPDHPISDGTPYPTREEIYDRPVLRRHKRAGLHAGQPGLAEEGAGYEMDHGTVARPKRRRKSADNE